MNSTARNAKAGVRPRPQGGGASPSSVSQWLNGKLNAIVHLLEKEARLRAKETDEALARGQSGGVCTAFPDDQRIVAPEDAVIVKRIKSAGAVILGKTNVPANLEGYQVQGDIYPEGKNPHRVECSPGGSTAGGAAAVALA